MDAASLVTAVSTGGASKQFCTLCRKLVSEANDGTVSLFSQIIAHLSATKGAGGLSEGKFDGALRTHLDASGAYWLLSTQQVSLSSQDTLAQFNSHCRRRTRST